MMLISLTFSRHHNKIVYELDHATKERALLVREDLSAQGFDLGDISRRVDGKGVVTFTVASGGILDAGKSFSIPPMTKNTCLCRAEIGGKYRLGKRENPVPPNA